MLRQEYTNASQQFNDLLFRSVIIQDHLLHRELEHLAKSNAEARPTEYCPGTIRLLEKNIRHRCVQGTKGRCPQI